MSGTFKTVRDNLRSTRRTRLWTAAELDARGFDPCLEGHRWTQSDLAREADVPPDWVEHLENAARCVMIPGDRRSPEWWTRFKLVCEALGLDGLDELRKADLL